ncbi:enoyl-CoA hydratase/isomerase family protein [Novosphingobium malaysiense]|uniref:Enoyl-CoA hydratase n=1 Tax=Novosphingobium malaysiense TaxID=1348853 RepID=A0A0B1ZH38_9SPHN|nr:enoyl-CoA hydratase-related protein [Novosphingobium malaysiense]KHK90426.1 hypothetical protein LK12_17790 [Novosphingobium malaysiense]
MPDLIIDSRAGITTLTLNRPERHNALSPSLSAAMAEAVADFKADGDQRVLVVTGTGEKAFCSGWDLKRARGAQEQLGGGDQKRSLPIAKSAEMYGLATCEKPVIAAINGLAVGGGFEIAQCCDIRVAVEEAWFGLPEVQRGFIAGVSAMNLPRHLPYGVAADIMLAGQRLTAHDAFRFGFVQEVTERGDLMAAVMRRAESIAKSSQSALWGTKLVLRYWRDLMLSEHYRHYEAVAHRVLLSGDMVEGIKAFSEKREARFAGGWPDPLEQ